MHFKDEGTDTASLYHHHHFFFLPSPEMCAHISHTGDGKETVIQANKDGAWGTGAANQWPHPILVNSMFGPSTAADFCHLLSKHRPLQRNTAEACIPITKREVPDWVITPRHPWTLGCQRDHRSLTLQGSKASAAKSTKPPDRTRTWKLCLQGL